MKKSAGKCSVYSFKQVFLDLLLRLCQKIFPLNKPRGSVQRRYQVIGRPEQIVNMLRIAGLYFADRRSDLTYAHFLEIIVQGKLKTSSRIRYDCIQREPLS